MDNQESLDQGFTYKRSRSELLEDMQACDDWLASLGLQSHDRIRQLLAILKAHDQALSEGTAQEYVESLSAQHRIEFPLALVYAEAKQISEIHAAFKASRSRGLVKKLKDAISGPLFVTSESPETNQGRNVAFELTLAARMVSGGGEIEIGERPDIIYSILGQPVVIECKRPFKQETIRDNILKANEQIAKRWRDRTIITETGVIAISLTRVINPTSSVREAEDTDSIEREEQETLFKLCDTVVDTVLEKLHDRVIGILFFSDTLIGNTKSGWVESRSYTVPVNLSDRLGRLILQDILNTMANRRELEQPAIYESPDEKLKRLAASGPDDELFMHVMGMKGGRIGLDAVALARLGHYVLSSQPNRIEKGEWFDRLSAESVPLDPTLRALVEQYIATEDPEQKIKGLALLITRGRLNIAAEAAAAMETLHQVCGWVLSEERAIQSGDLQRRLESSYAASITGDRPVLDTDASSTLFHRALSAFTYALSFLLYVSRRMYVRFSHQTIKLAEEGIHRQMQYLRKQATASLEASFTLLADKPYAKELARELLRCGSPIALGATRLWAQAFPELISQEEAVSFLNSEAMDERSLGVAVLIRKEPVANSAFLERHLRNELQRVLRFSDQERDDYDVDLPKGLLDLLHQSDRVAWLRVADKEIWPQRERPIFRALVLQVIKHGLAEPFDGLESWIVDGVLRQRHFAYEALLKMASDAMRPDLVLLVLRHPREDYVHSIRIFMDAVQSTHCRSEAAEILHSPLYKTPGLNPFTTQLLDVI